MKIGVISDTHISSVGDEFKDFIKRYFSDVDAIIHAGDFVDISIAQFLDNFTELKFYGVSGNMDRGMIQHELPRKRIIEFNGVKIGLIHGWGAPDKLEERVLGEFSGDRVDCVVFGHSHSATNMKKNGILLFNPGSPFDRRFAKNNTIGYLKIDDGVTGEIVKI
jgi:putative phosphoesterase